MLTRPSLILQPGKYHCLTAIGRVCRRQCRLAGHVGSFPSFKMGVDTKLASSSRSVVCTTIRISVTGIESGQSFTKVRRDYSHRVCPFSIWTTPAEPKTRANTIAVARCDQFDTRRLRQRVVLGVTHRHYALRGYSTGGSSAGNNVVLSLLSIILGVLAASRQIFPSKTFIFAWTALLLPKKKTHSQIKSAPRWWTAKNLRSFLSSARVS